MIEYSKHYIDGAWVESSAPKDRDEVIDPAHEAVVGHVARGTAEDANRAVAAAKRAFPSYAATSVDERKALLDRIIAVYQRRMGEVASSVTTEMGAPGWLAKAAHAGGGLAHFAEARRVLDTYAFESVSGQNMILREPAGVCALITPWNWPVLQVVCKVAPALAVGCTVVLKPAETSPLDAILLAEIMHEAGVPKGVFNLVTGHGAEVGMALASHPDVDMVSFTGSTGVGKTISKLAADTVKRVSLELGGKSANIILDDANLSKAVASGVVQLMMNTGQSCNAPSRMLVSRKQYDEAVSIATTTAKSFKVMDPATAEKGAMGPLANRKQYETVRGYIAKGIAEGAKITTGGADRPEGLDKGYFVRPTIFADVSPKMTIAQEEIFGPVLTMIPYADEDDAVRIANDSIYGLSGYVQSGSLDRARQVARRMRTGSVHLNGARTDFTAPFGGYKQSGHGREWGVHGLDEFTEIKAVLGWTPAEKA